MYFAAKLASLVLAVAVSALQAQASVVARNELAELSVVFYDDVNFVGASYSADGIVQGVCNTLPGHWLDRAESVVIDPGFTCRFFTYQGCPGGGIPLSGSVYSLPDPLYNGVESFLCTKDI